jgi:hypothetical protein
MTTYRDYTEWDSARERSRADAGVQDGDFEELFDAVFRRRVGELIARSVLSSKKRKPSPQEYRNNARKCLRLAKEAQTEEARARWLTFAQFWFTFAQHAEDNR